MLILVTLFALAACSSSGSDMSDEEVKQSLVALIGEIDEAYKAQSAPPLNNPIKLMLWTVDLESKQLEIVDSYLFENNYPAEVKEHMVDMRDGLSIRVATYEYWLEMGVTPDTAPAEEAKTVDDAAQQSTYAEQQLRIAAGL